ncbi:hypothetical protein [Chromatocurvus halotolerans]|uniref:DUF202 domain-containing protein n=1 Tax=Chromatocurvus halotolerans TaxID=1132028 RepID=A0A4R2KZL0_9GAMM|nr:hypothetical protein [Chromatocurvus halotolerans]TCO78367.1 hypothetical protein EV688_101183 [Chromatocurvus halotolerans]
MKHPELQKREWETTFNRRRDRYWYRWMGLYTLALFAVLVLVYAAQSNSAGAMVSVIASLFVIGVVLTGWFARQRALEEMESAPGDVSASTQAD